MWLAGREGEGSRARGLRGRVRAGRPLGPVGRGGPVGAFVGAPGRGRAGRADGERGATRPSPATNARPSFSCSFRHARCRVMPPSCGDVSSCPCKNRTVPSRTLTLLMASLAAALTCWILCASYAAEPARKGDAKAVGIDKRVPWTTSRRQGLARAAAPVPLGGGLPEAEVRRAAGPVARSPGSDRLAVAERHGKIFTFAPTRKTDAGGPAARREDDHLRDRLSSAIREERLLLCHLHRRPGQEQPDGQPR